MSSFTAKRGGARTMGKRTMGKKNKLPCEDFEANEKAFGKCRKCNFSLAEHFSGGAEEADDIAPPPPVEEVQEKKVAAQACRNFTWKKSDDNDQWAGVCECGFPKAEHEKEDRGVSMRLSRNLSHMGKKISKRFSVTKGKVILANPVGVACDDFRLNLEGDQYGLCKCGFNKLDHQKADQKRAQYTAEKKAKEDQAARIARGDTSVACTSFVLDLANKEGYGYCTCGFRRDQHQDFSTKADYANVQLSKPKDFV